MDHFRNSLLFGQTQSVKISSIHLESRMKPVVSSNASTALRTTSGNQVGCGL